MLGLLSMSSKDYAESHVSSAATRYRRIVVKVGTTLLTHESDQLNMQVMAALVEQMARLHEHGAEVVLVSSGAVAAGRHVLGMSREKRSVPFRQMMAAAGQGRLMHAYAQLFDWHQIPVAQALLTRKDFSDRLGYLNVRNTLLSLLELRVVPIVNENDVVSVDELDGEMFGDNDTLSALVANLIDADVLVMLGDMEGLYTADPHVDRDAQLVPLVERLDRDVQAVAGGSWGGVGRGGMTTKLEAARLATTSGVDVVIASGHVSHILENLARGEHIGTFFPAAVSKMESRKRWMRSGLSTQGEIVVDDGAATALRRSNRSLLPAGVSEVVGTFDRGDIVSIVDRSSTQLFTGIANYGATDLIHIKGLHSREIQEKVGHHYGDEVVHRNNMVAV